jgi:hypothetical protein
MSYFVIESEDKGLLRGFMYGFAYGYKARTNYEIDIHDDYMIIKIDSDADNQTFTLDKEGLKHKHTGGEI